MARKNPEQQLQIAVADYLHAVLRPPTMWTAFPAGGGGKIRGALLKAMGLKPGWPDILIIHRFDDLAETLVLGIELKAGEGRQTPEQREVMESLRATGAVYEVCRSIDEVDWALMDHGIPCAVARRSPSTQQERAA